MKNIFKIKFSLPCSGWQSICFKNNNETQIYVSASYVYPPYSDFLRTFQLLTNKNYLPLHFKKNNVYYYFENTQSKLRKREVTLNIDREGYGSEITFKPIGKKVKITTKTLKDSKKESVETGGRAKSIVYNKKQVLNEIQNSLKEYNKRFNKRFKNDLKLEKKYLSTKNEDDYVYNDMATELKCSYIMKYINNPKKIKL